MNGSISLLAMNDGQIRLAIILGYLGLLLLLGFFASRFFRGTKQDYLLACLLYTSPSPRDRG